ncbi:CAAX protease self-immunity [Halopenitus persicus]|uniref:CAAX protease self-immunity n=2 Tax=Halopenitus persicus TaxID=1048396 RepID=A0A1H3NBE0_9EURY|nr:CAAX protease self-immunity [Halopenitus persicus]
MGGLVSLFDLTESPVVRVLQGNYIQVGFAGAYLVRQGDWNRYVKIRGPTFEDIDWIVGLPLLFAAQGMVLPPILAAVGLPHPQPGTGMEELALETRPLLWPIAFTGMYLFAAPAEELVYRGLVQGRLRAAFDTLGVVILGGLLFGVMHFLVGLMTQGVSFGGSLYWGIDTVVPGLVWGYAYERTENLLVTVVTHAMAWTVALHEIVLYVLRI